MYTGKAAHSIDVNYWTTKYTRCSTICQLPC